jgi:hypothetical protein
VPIRIDSILLLGVMGALAAATGCHSDPAGASGAAGSPAAETKAAGEAQAGADAQLALVAPRLGGNVLAVGEHQVELAILENGLVQGLVYDAHGQAVAVAELPEVAVALRTRGGGRPSATLVWVAAHACLEGRAQLQAGLVAEPIDVTLSGAARATATLSDYAIQPFARFAGSVLAVGPYAVELVAKPDLMLAYVLDATGKVQSATDWTLQLQVGAAGGSKLDFKWDPTRAAYSAALGAQLKLSGEPLRLGLMAGGKTYLGAVQSLEALAAARVDARAQLETVRLDAQLKTGAQAIGDSKAKLSAGAKSSAGARAQAKASAKVPVPKATVPKATVPKVSVQKSARASASSSTSKASAGVKASASFGFGK